MNDHSAWIIPAAERFAIPELVRATLLHVDCKWGQHTFSNCALVSHCWMNIVRRLRYTTFAYHIVYPQRDGPDPEAHILQQSDMENYPIYRAQRSLNELLTDFDRFPFVCGYIEHLELLADNFPEPEGQEEDDDEDEPQWRELSARTLPVLESGKVGIQSALFLQVITRLTSLRSLVVSDVLADWESLATLPKPVIPKLDYLQIKQPYLHEDVSLNRFRCFMRLFGTVRRLELTNIWFHDWDEEDSPPDADLSHLEVAELCLEENWCRWSGVFLQTVSELPNCHMFTCLDLPWVPPEDIPSLCDILYVCSSNLLYLGFQLERGPPNLAVDHQDMQESMHYLALDLTNCVKLQVLTLRIYYHFLEEIPKNIRDSAASAGVANFLAPFLEDKIPKDLQCLDFKMHPGHKLQIQKVDFERVEDIILRAVNRHRVRSVSLTPWWSGTFEKKWDTFSSFLPRLAHRGTLVQRNEWTSLKP